MSDLNPGDNIYFNYSGNILLLSDNEIRQLLIEKIPINSKCFMLLDCTNRYNPFNLQFNIKYLSENTITIFKDYKYDIKNKDNPGSIILLSSYYDRQIDNKIKHQYVLTQALLNILNNKTNDDKYTLDMILYKINEYLIENKYTNYYQLSSDNLNIYNIFTQHMEA